MSAPTGPDFYSTVDQAPQQGDILLAHVARVAADDDFVPTRWQVLDEGRFELLPTLPLAGGAVLAALRVVGGRALVMVTTPDCGLDKEFNAVDHSYRTTIDRLSYPARLTRRRPTKRRLIPDGLTNQTT